MPIRVLDTEVVSRIAAGEVVERPASAVKELVENSLDAGATQISVEARDGGVGLIRVVFQRYATSKIASLDDLDSISSLGFRGEALSSIAAVAEVEVATCTTGEAAGSYISTREGTVARKESRAHPKGTTLAVRSLFRQVPARLKFLKSAMTENSHIANVVTQYALARPEVRFSLSIDGKEVLRTPGSGRLIDSIVEIYGAEVARNMLEVGDEANEWRGSIEAPRVSGMVGAPAINRANRGYLSFFVNRRWISSRLLTWAVEEAYHGLLMQGKHPVAVVNLSLPLQQVDVNVHPTKTELKFSNERLVFSSVQRTVRHALVGSGPPPQTEEVTAAYRTPTTPRQSLFTTPAPARQPSALAAEDALTPTLSLPALRVLGQLMASYIVAEGPDGLYLIDQHAAHERVLFERTRQQLAQRKIEVQGLLEPSMLEVDPKQDAVLRDHYREMADFGFSMEPFGNRSYLVRTVPVSLSGKDWLSALREICASSPYQNRDGWQERVAISIACHSAVRAGQTLSNDEIRQLIRGLEGAELPGTCPHGRPTIIHLSAARLEKDFGRS
jgi:DNA mismatch repair protein MutL